MPNLKINHVIVHELLKEKDKDFDHSKRYNLRDSELDKTNAVVISLVEGVVALYGSKGNSAHYGVFKSAPKEQGPIPVLFDQYHQTATSQSIDFINLTKKIMEQMYHSAKSQSWSSGGYIVFTDYISAGIRYFLVAMIKKTNGVTISEKLEPEEMIHLE
ncbi:TPA: nucleoid-associated protein, partial [Escherichia coli]|nr:nucleoid-associated protein [Escherichia coli]